MGCVSFPMREILHRGRVQASEEFSEKCSKCVTLRVPALRVNLNICTGQSKQKAFPKSQRYRANSPQLHFSVPKLLPPGSAGEVSRALWEERGLSTLRTRKSLLFTPYIKADCTLCFLTGGDGSCPSRALGPRKLHSAHFRRGDLLPKYIEIENFVSPLQNEPLQQDQSPFPAVTRGSPMPGNGASSGQDRGKARVTSCSLFWLLPNGSSPLMDKSEPLLAWCNCG